MADTPRFERRTRIVCHFPMNRKATGYQANQLRVIRGFLAYLHTTNITGFTSSFVMDDIFTGYWRTDPSSAFEKENIALIVIDHPLDKDDPAVGQFALSLKGEIQKLYKRYAGEKEQEIWIVIHSIERLL